MPMVMTTAKPAREAAAGPNTLPAVLPATNPAIAWTRTMMREDAEIKLLEVYKTLPKISAQMSMGRLHQRSPVDEGFRAGVVLLSTAVGVRTVCKRATLHGKVI